MSGFVPRGQADGPAPVLLPELEADGAAEVDQLLLAELRVQPVPEGIVRRVRVPCDRMGPFEGEARPAP